MCLNQFWNNLRRYGNNITNYKCVKLNWIERSRTVRFLFRAPSWSKSSRTWRKSFARTSWCPGPTKMKILAHTFSQKFEILSNNNRMDRWWWNRYCQWTKVVIWFWIFSDVIHQSWSPIFLRASYTCGLRQLWWLNVAVTARACKLSPRDRTIPVVSCVIACPISPLV